MDGEPPVLDIGMTCWNRYPERFRYFRRTVEALKANLITDGLRVNYIVSCEGEGNVDAAAFESYCERQQLALVYHPGEPNLGAHRDYLFGLCRGDATLYIQDDYVLKHPLNVAEDLRFLRENPTFVAVRYCVWNDDLHVEPHPPDDCLPGSPGLKEVSRKTKWFFTDNPCLRQPDLPRRFGPYFIPIDPGDHHDHWTSEYAMSERVRASPFRLAVKHDGRAFDHVGDVSSLDQPWRDVRG